MMSFVKRFFGSAAPATNALKEVILKETASNEVRVLTSIGTGDCNCFVIFKFRHVMCHLCYC
jgi:hypothetical protein